MDELVYRVNRSTISIRIGDITTSLAEVLVSSDDGHLTHGGGVSAAIYRAAGGPILDREYHKLTQRSLPAGHVSVTSAGDLPAKYILHAITIDPVSWELPEGTIVRQLTRRIVELLPLLGCRSMALPSIGSGVARIPAEQVATEMGGVLVRALLETTDEYNLELYLTPDQVGGMDPHQRLNLFATHIRRSLGLEASGETAGVVAQPPTLDAPTDTRRQQIYQMLRQLDTRRDELESTLVETLVQGHAASALTELRDQLEDLKHFRRLYEAELGIAAPKPRSVPNSVFVSSTWTDLQPHRQALRQLINRLSLTYRGMDDFQPAGRAPALYIRDRVEEAEVYLGVLGWRYGSIDPASGLSMTELEYRQAVTSNKQRLVFVMGEEAQIPISMFEHDPAALTKLFAFRHAVLSENVVKLFSTVDELVSAAEQALGSHLEST